jgi:hypothetical protein
MWLPHLNLGLETVAQNSFHAVGLPRVPLGEEARCDAGPVSRSSAVATFTRMLAGFSLWTRSLRTGRGAYQTATRRSASMAFTRRRWRSAISKALRGEVNLAWHDLRASDEIRP